MVKRISIILTALLLSVSAGAQEKEGLNGDKLRELMRKAESEHARRQRNLKYDEMHELYRVTSKKGHGAGRDRSGPDAKKAPEKGQGLDADDQSRSGGGNAVGPGRAITTPGPTGNTVSPNPGVKPAPATSRVGRYGGDRYIPRSANAGQSGGGGGGFAVDQIKEQGPYFGIRMGTRIYAEIRRAVTNAERNLCEIYVLQDVHGDIETMPSGTVIFAAKQFNTGTNKLEISTVKGITPEGEEFALSAYGMDASESAGLSGTITTDGKAAKRSISQGAFEVSKGVASALNNGTVVGAGVEAATQNILTEKESETEKQLNQPQYIIRVEPQPVILMVDSTF